MATQVQNRRGTTTQHSTFTGAAGELTVDTDKKTVVVHDGTTAGGAPLLRENGSQNAVTTGTSTAASFIPSSSTVPTNGVYLPAANTVGLATNGTGRLFVDSSGRVGVGTTSAAEKLEVNGAIRVTNESAGWGSGTEGAFLDYYAPASQARFGHLSGASGSAKNVVCYTGGSEAFRVDSSRRLLIGTSSARTPLTHSPSLQVEGVGYAASTISVIANSSDSNGAYSFIGKTRGTSVGSNTIVQSGDEIGGLDFIAADGTQLLRAARITAMVDGTPGTNDMPGRLVFSTTTDGASSPTERMRITTEGGMRLFGSPGGVTQYLNSDRVASTGDFLIYGNYSATSTTTGTLSFSVATNGNVRNTNNSYGALSDAKLKENIVDANSQWSDIKALQVRNYNFKEGQTHTQIGLVAQEVEPISPGLVYESPDRDAEGNDLGTVTKSVNYSVLYMKAVKALQEAMERIETLEAKVAALEAA